ncbi:MAG: GIY-YIG nuclease family protein [Blastocatellia bacterium]
MPTATIKIFLVQGNPKSLRTAELSNWTGKAVAGPRSEFESVIARDEAANPGVYLLTGADPETGRAAVYIGEAENIRSRIKSHLEKDFWSQVAFFISKDENLTKAHVRYLEGRLIEIAKQADRATLVNSQGSGARLPESDREDMEVFLEKIQQLLPVLGVDLLMAPQANVSNVDDQSVLICEIKGVTARGYRTPEGFLILKGSEAVLQDRPSSEKWPWAKEMRKQLVANGILIEAGQKLIFTADEVCTSPSTAAAIIHGGHANGLVAWRNRDGRTLKEIESK